MMELRKWVLSKLCSTRVLMCLLQIAELIWFPVAVIAMNFKDLVSPLCIPPSPHQSRVSIAIWLYYISIPSKRGEFIKRKTYSWKTTHISLVNENENLQPQPASRSNRKNQCKRLSSCPVLFNTYYQNMHLNRSLLENKLEII